jgi:hypothetical protein
MGFTTLERMKRALLTATVSSTERLVLLDMAVAVDDTTGIYSWGHERLALAIGKMPGTPAAKQALSGRVIPSLIARGLISKTSSAYPGHRAEYELLVLRGPESSNGSGKAEPGMGNALDEEWITVSDGKGNAQAVTPLTSSLPSFTPPSLVHAETDDVIEVSSMENTFEGVWGHWPRKNSKKAARTNFNLAVKQHPRGESGLAADIAEHAGAYTRHEHPTQFVPMLSTWLNGERWNDPLPAVRSNGTVNDGNREVLSRYFPADEDAS